MAYDLEPVPWHGGSSYYTVGQTGPMMAKAEAAGWSNPSFFPVGVWAQRYVYWDFFRGLGINLGVGLIHEAFDLTAHCAEIAANGGGFFYFPDDRPGLWTAEETGNAACVVGHSVDDEVEMRESDPVAYQTNYINSIRARNDGRFIYSNYGRGAQGVPGSWNSEDMPVLVPQNDVASADLYYWTDSWTAGTASDWTVSAPNWPAGQPFRASENYGWTVDQMMSFQSSSRRIPIWNYVEVGNPNSNSRTITPDELEGAVWASIVAGATGIVYFNHSFGGPCQSDNVLFDCDPAVATRITQVHTRIRSLATLINRQSYTWNAGAAVRTMVKKVADHYVVFAVLGNNVAPGTQTIYVPVTSGTATVVGESRTVAVTDGQIMDNLLQDHTMHVYELPPEPPTARYWAGATWSEGPIRYWNGLDWVQPLGVKEWNGVAWV